MRAITVIAALGVLLWVGWGSGTADDTPQEGLENKRASASSVNMGIQRVAYRPYDSWERLRLAAITWAAPVAARRAIVVGVYQPAEIWMAEECWRDTAFTSNWDFAEVGPHGYMAVSDESAGWLRDAMREASVAWKDKVGKEKPIPRATWGEVLTSLQAKYATYDNSAAYSWAKDLKFVSRQPEVCGMRSNEMWIAYPGIKIEGQHIDYQEPKSNE